MNAAGPFPLVAVDVGNQRTKLGLFDGPMASGLPEPSRTLSVGNEQPLLEGVQEWLGDIGEVASWWIGSVNRPATTRLVDWLRNRVPRGELTLLAAGDLPLRVDLPRPDMVGIDRLLDAVAANALRAPDRPAAVVDVGSAITVDWVSAEGIFMGGAIAPGITMSARALHTFTDMLPLVEMSELENPPPPLGRSTVAAIQSGLFWGAVGMIRQLIEVQGDGTNPGPQIFVTGGAGPAVAGLLGLTARHVPHLTLSGIALVAAAQSVPPKFEI